MKSNLKMQFSSPSIERDTIVVATADHSTGGMSIDRNGNSGSPLGMPFYAFFNII
ncbi:hypothetical protein V7157_22530 [Neobacillus drentensis]|uniref:hypothetical protein n=1 Tax=Neobacillus drentensis TaxID=220684 RepID=UPI00300328C0